MVLGINILIACFVFIFICEIIGFILLKYKEWDEPEDDIEVRTYMTQFTQGRSEGKLRSTFERGGRV